MPFDINQYLQRGLVYGGARTSKFDVNLTIPTNVLSSDSATIDPASQDKLTFTCVAASIPSFQIGEVQLPYFGRKIKSAGDRVWSNWRISVQIDEDYATRAMFEAWNNALNRIESNVLQGNLANESYKASWFITRYGRDNSIIRK